MQIYIKELLILQEAVYNYDKIMSFHNCVYSNKYSYII
jgi:hypothetical protein